MISRSKLAAIGRSVFDLPSEVLSNTWASWRNNESTTTGKKIITRVPATDATPIRNSVINTGRDTHRTTDGGISTVVEVQKADLESSLESVLSTGIEHASDSDMSNKALINPAIDPSIDPAISPGNPPTSAAAVSVQAADKGNGRNTTLMPLDIKVPPQLGKYVIGARLGSGTCGVVHRALDDELGREIAIKLSPLGENAPTGKVPGAQRAYQTEVYAAGRLRHPNIVTVYSSGQFEELNYIAMEVIEGKSLKSYGKGQTLLPTYRALEVICECCKALDYSHRQDILHRDIKPANIMVGDDGNVKLLDFGIAVGLSEKSGLSRRGPTLGTPNYMSPEQILGKTLSPASDFYSLGTVLFELLTGKQLFKAKKVKDLFRTVVHQPAPTLIEFRPDLPQALSDILNKVLHKKPENRFQSGMEMIDALSRFVENFKIIEERSPEQKELLETLHRLPFFDSFSGVDVARLLTHCSLRHYQQGDILITHGDSSRNLLLVVDGTVVVESDKSLHRVYGAGQCVGELGFIHGAQEILDVRAVSKLRALEITADTLGELPPKLHLHYYKRISDILVWRMARQRQPFKVDLELA